MIKVNINYSLNHGLKMDLRAVIYSIWGSVSNGLNKYKTEDGVKLLASSGLFYAYLNAYVIIQLIMPAASLAKKTGDYIDKTAINPPAHSLVLKENRINPLNRTPRFEGTGGDPDNNPALGPEDAGLAAVADSLHIRLIATQSGMDSSRFRVQYVQKVVSLPDTLKLTFIYMDNPLESFLKPYIEDSTASIKIIDIPVPGERTRKGILYIPTKTGVFKFGYDVITQTPGEQKTRHDVGFCDSDVGIWDLVYALPSGFPKSPSKVTLEAIVPTGMKVYAPFPNKPGSENEFIIQGDPSLWRNTGGLNLGHISWGRPQSEKSFTFGNNAHTVWILGYDTDIRNISSVIESSYNYFMLAAIECPILFSHKGIISILPPGTLEENSNILTGNGAGFYVNNVTNENLSPGAVSTNEDYSPSYRFNLYPDLNEFCLAGVGMVLRTIFDPWVSENWIMWGSEKHHARIIFQNMGVTNELITTAENIRDLDYYQKIIIPGGLDETLNTATDWNLIWVKGPLMHDALDMAVKESTNNRSSLMDVWLSYYKELKARGGAANTSYGERYIMFIESLEEVTKKDFLPWFQKYIEGSEPLPLEKIVNVIVLTDSLYSSGTVQVSPDFDVNGTLGTSDAVSMLKIKITEPENPYTDWNKDGKKSITDVISLLLYIKSHKTKSIQFLGGKDD